MQDKTPDGGRCKPTRAYTRTQLRALKHTYTCKHAYIHTYIHTYTHTHTYTHLGYSVKCEFRLQCGHICRRLCHPDDSTHTTGMERCREPCTKLRECGHACQGICNEPCVCDVEVVLQLPCGHQKKTLCKHRLKPQVCRERVSAAKEYAVCGHAQSLGMVPCDVACLLARVAAGMGAQEVLADINGVFNKESSYVSLFRCTQKCGGRRGDCELLHDCTLDCGKCTLESFVRGRTWEAARDRTSYPGACPTICTRQLMCGHNCAGGTCHQRDKCSPCDKQCEIACAHSKCPKMCSDLCTLCSMPCEWRCTRAHRKRAPLCVRAHACGCRATSAATRCCRVDISAPVCVEKLAPVLSSARNATRASSLPSAPASAP
jgi:hypothetical protein